MSLNESAKDESDESERVESVSRSESEFDDVADFGAVQVSIRLTQTQYDYLTKYIRTTDDFRLHTTQFVVGVRHHEQY